MVWALMVTVVAATVTKVAMVAKVAQDSETQISQQRRPARVRPLHSLIRRWPLRLRYHLAIGRELSQHRSRHRCRIQFLGPCMYRLHLFYHVRLLVRLSARGPNPMVVKITRLDTALRTLPGNQTNLGYSYYVGGRMTDPHHSPACLKRRRASSPQTMILLTAHNLTSWTTRYGTHSTPSRPRWNT